MTTSESGISLGGLARDHAGGRYNDQADRVPQRAPQPGGGAKLKTICPDRLAQKILLACQQRDPEPVVPATARILFALSQLWPPVGDWILRRRT